HDGGRDRTVSAKLFTANRRKIASLRALVLRHSRIFLLSPANLAGIRAGYVTRPDSVLDLACRLRQQGASLGELFSFISGLYFRGKLAYAQAFGACSPPLEGSFVITPTAGLISPETIVTLDRLLVLAANDIDP